MASKKIVQLSNRSKKKRQAKNVTCRFVLTYTPERNEAWIHLWDLLLAPEPRAEAA